MAGRLKTIAFLFAILFVVAPVFFFQIAFSSKETPRYVSECLDCHEDREESLLGSAHQIHVGEGAGILIGCSDCHLNAEQHMDDPDEYKPDNPASMSVVMAAQVCANCHATSHNQNTIERDPHGDANVNCSGCHLVHDNKELRLLKDEQTELCFGCHREVVADFTKPFRHPVNDNIVACSECHMTQSESHRQYTGNGVGEVCYACHERFRPPFPYQHQATMDFSTEEGGCLNCHAAHGSDVARMLKQTYEAPNFSLCTQCHTVPGHQFNSFHGTAWAGMPCNDCHVDIHGSYLNRFFLSPAIEAQGCGAVGCHNF